LSEEDFAKLRAASRHSIIVQSGNFGLGVNVLAMLVKRAAKALDPDYDIEIVEMHHRMKVDAPSGTALLLGEAAAQGRGIALEDSMDKARDGHHGARKAGDIGFASLRGGTVPGEHSVIFAGPGERITLSHSAESRDNWANGAIKAALWARGRKPGYFSMTDVLGLTD
jgi:4-hydroxy-tetrahydrodipicolinate reductase